MQPSLGPLVRITLVIGGLSMLVPGIWAFVAPAGFADTVATFDPYNRHYLHDVGAFQIGVGVAALVALRWRDGAVVGLSAFLAAGGVHAVSHLIDRDLGGRASDAPLLFALAALALVALVAGCARCGRRNGPPSRHRSGSPTGRRPGSPHQVDQGAVRAKAWAAARAGRPARRSADRTAR
jgi:uncharacterized membrane protein